MSRLGVKKVWGLTATALVLAAGGVGILRFVVFPAARAETAVAAGPAVAEAVEEPAVAVAAAEAAASVRPAASEAKSGSASAAKSAASRGAAAEKSTGPAAASAPKSAAASVATPGQPAGAKARTVVEGDAAKRQVLELFQKAQEKLKSITGYTATFVKQERVDGVLLPAQTILLKIRHEPFSVYMKWDSPTAGREVLYVDGQNNGDMIAHEPRGTLAGFLRRVNLDPKGRMGMKGNRHPANEAGIANLVARHLPFKKLELEQPEAVTRLTETKSLEGGRPLWKCDHLHPQKDRGHEMHKLTVYIDKEYGVPIHYEGYDWPDPQKPNEDVLLERYTYSNLKLNVAFSEPEFDAKNTEYDF